MRRRKTVELTLEKIYSLYHKTEYLKPDPLQFLSDYDDIRDREIVGLICAALALGRVNSILKILSFVLERLPSPYMNLLEWDEEELEQRFDGFLYRFYKSHDLVNLLSAIGNTIRQFGSLNNCFLSGYHKKDDSILPALQFFVKTLNNPNRLKMLPDPEKSSACKRLMLYLRWMIRNDNIDPGGWSGIPASKLIIPLDTHMLKVGEILKLTERKDGGMKTALQITETLRKYDKEDPVRFDFSLTRPGIHPELNYREFHM